jgi:hypothetical protein
MSIIESYYESDHDLVSASTFNSADDERGQTFTIGNTGSNLKWNLNKVTFYLGGKDGTPGTVYCYLKVVDGEGLPTGVALSTGSRDGNDISISNYLEDEPFEFNMSSYILQPSTQYAIYVTAPNLGVGDEFTMGFKNAANQGTYTGGDGINNNDGEGWTLSSNRDRLFIISGSLASPTPTGYMAIQDAGGIIKLPIITSGDAVSYNDDETIRICNAGNIYCADLISGGDTGASAFRIQTPKGTKAWRESGA